MTADVVVTGIGAVCTAGTSVARIWAGMEAGATRPITVDDPDARMPYPLLYTVGDDVGSASVDGQEVGRTTTLLLLAAREALGEAGWPTALAGAMPAARIGVVVGTGMGESGAHEQHRATGGGGTPATRPVFSPASDLARALGARGPALSVSNACAAGAYAVGEARELLDSGECDVVLACGAESYSRVALGCFNRMGAVDPERCRPFAAERGGTVFGEGAAVLVLERGTGAAERGVTPAARLLGAGFSCDADHPTAPSPDGVQAVRALREALREAGVAPADVAAVVPHGTGTTQNDSVETGILAEVFGERAPSLPLYSLKALIGHTGGAAGALAAAAAVEILRRRRIPGNVDVGALDPAFDVDLPLSRTDLPDGPVVVNAYAFGGNNASLVLAGVS